MRSPSSSTAATTRCVYPIKVNQQRHVCEQIANLGRRAQLRARGRQSKPELLAVLGLSAVAGGPGVNGMPIICNGFKDDEFIETVILATKLGRNIIPVVEKFSELELIVKHAKAYSVRPKIGIRVKLSSRGAGRWEASRGRPLQVRPVRHRGAPGGRVPQEARACSTA